MSTFETSKQKKYKISDMYGDDYKQSSNNNCCKENIIIRVITWIIDAISLNIEIFLRRDFGERYFSLFKALFGFIALFFIGLLSYFTAEDVFVFRSRSLFSTAPVNTYDLEFTPYLLWGVFVLYIVHLVSIILRNREGEYKHSYYMGKSYDFIEKGSKNSELLDVIFKNSLMRKFFSQVIFEPIAILLIGFFLTWLTFFKMLGIILTILSIVFLVKMQIIYQRFRNRILDLKDGQVISKHLNDVVNNRVETNQSQGLTVLNLNSESFDKISTQEAIKKSFINNPDLKSFQVFKNKEKEQSTFQKMSKKYQNEMKNNSQIQPKKEEKNNDFDDFDDKPPMASVIT